jgi:hypothetical protein
MQLSRTCGRGRGPRRRSALVLVVGAAALVVVFASVLFPRAPSAASASIVNNVAPKPPFKQCPGTGADSSCGILIWFPGIGQPQVLIDHSQGPYDGGDDTLVGVENDGQAALKSMTLGAAAPGAQSGIAVGDPFGFDGDGACNGYYSGPGCPFGPTGYEGPHTQFLVSNAQTGTVVFTSALHAQGGHAWFTLEDALRSVNSFQIQGISGTTPQGIAFTSMPFPPFGSAADQRLTAQDRISTAIAQSIIGAIFPPAGLAFTIGELRGVVADWSKLQAACKADVGYDEQRCTAARKQFVRDDLQAAADLASAGLAKKYRLAEQFVSTGATIQEIVAGH